MDVMILPVFVKITDWNKGAFKSLLNILDGDYLRKWVTALNRQLFRKKVLSQQFDRKLNTPQSKL